MNDPYSFFLLLVYTSVFGMCFHTDRLLVPSFCNLCAKRGYKATNVYFMQLPKCPMNHDLLPLVRTTRIIEGRLGKFWRGSGELSRHFLKPPFL